MIFCSSQKYVFLAQLKDYLSNKGTFVQAIFTKYKFFISCENMSGLYKHAYSLLLEVAISSFCILLYVPTFKIIKFAPLYNRTWSLHLLIYDITAYLVAWLVRGGGRTTITLCLSHIFINHASEPPNLKLFLYFIFIIIVSSIVIMVC